MYFDPGTGSMLIQMLLGAIPVIAAIFIGFRKKLFGKKPDGESAEDIEKNNTEDGFEDIDDE